MQMTLYHISELYQQAAEKLADMDLPPEVVTDTLAGLTGDLEVKATNVAMFAKNLEGLADQIKQAEEQMAHRRRIIENRAEAIRDYIKQCMETAGMSKIECPYFRLSIKKNPPAVEIEDEGMVPGIFLETPPPPPPRPDKKRIKEMLMAGLPVAGTRLTQRTRLEIK